MVLQEGLHRPAQQGGVVSRQRSDDQHRRLQVLAAAFLSPVLRQFEAETGIKVNFSVFDSNDVAETTLSAGNSGFDLVTVNAVPHLGRQIPKGLGRPLDPSSFTTSATWTANCFRCWRRRPRKPVCDPLHVGNHGAHLQRRQDPLDHARRPVESLAMIFRPDLVERFKSCGVSVLNSWVDMLPITSGYLGQARYWPSLPT